MLLKQLFRFKLLYSSSSLLVIALYNASTWGLQQLFLCIPDQKGNATRLEFMDCIDIFLNSQTLDNKNNGCEITFLKRFDSPPLYFATKAVSKNRTQQDIFCCDVSFYPEIVELLAEQ